MTDLNNDGALDILTTITSVVISLLGNGSGGFSRGQTVTATANNSPVVSIADLNQDGNLDLLQTLYLSNAIAIRLGEASQPLRP